MIEVVTCPGRPVCAHVETHHSQGSAKTGQILIIIIEHANNNSIKSGCVFVVAMQTSE